VDECPVDAFRHEEEFKRLSAHGPYDYRGHYQPLQTGSWRSKILVAANDLPSFPDRSGASAERLLVVRVQGSRLSDGEQDKRLLDRLSVELPAFAVQCIDAAKDVRQVGVYPASLAMLAARNQVAEEGDPLKAFVAEMLELELGQKAGWEVILMAVYREYVSWCRSTGNDRNIGQHRMLNNVMLSKRLREYDLWKIGVRNTKQGSVLTGVRLRSPGLGVASSPEAESAGDRSVCAGAEGEEVF
jgi:phage/plasmid-associated DNA primase